MKGVVLLKDLTDKKGRVYSKEELIEQTTGKTFIGQFDFGTSLEVQLDRASHFTNNIRIEGNNLVGDIDLIDSPMGTIAKVLFEEGVNLSTSIRATGIVNRVDGKYIVSELTVFGFDLIPERGKE